MEALLYLAGFGLLYLVITGRAAGQLLFFPYGIGNLSFDGVDITILVQNPSNTTFTVRSIAGNVFSENTLIGNVSEFTPIQIAPNSEQPVAVRLRFMQLGLVSDIIAAITTGHISKDFTVNGTVNANGVSMPLSIQYHVGN